MYISQVNIALLTHSRLMRMTSVNMYIKKQTNKTKQKQKNKQNKKHYKAKT